MSPEGRTSATRRSPRVIASGGRLALAALLACAAAAADARAGGRPVTNTKPAGAASESALRAVADRTLALDLSGWDWDTGGALHGLMRAAGATGDSRYRLKVVESVAPAIADLPPITHPNHVAPGLALLDLWAATGDERYLRSAEALGREAAALPRLPSGAFAHAPGEVWVDTLYMTVPFLARLATATGDAAWRDEAIRQFDAHARILASRGLWRHGWTYRDPEGPLGSLWLRGNGWAAAACADLLAELDDDDPSPPGGSGRSTCPRSGRPATAWPLRSTAVEWCAASRLGRDRRKRMRVTTRWPPGSCSSGARAQPCSSWPSPKSAQSFELRPTPSCSGPAGRPLGSR
jgi:hypothetical protein